MLKDENNAKIDVALKAIKQKRDRCFFGALIAPFLFVSLALLEMKSTLPMSKYIIAIGFCYMIVLIILYGFYEMAKCPKCGKNFIKTPFLKNPFTTKCMNCGLDLYTGKSEVENQSETDTS